MPKVLLTKRRNVEAKSEWFTLSANETDVFVETDFGTVRVARRRKGLEIHVSKLRQGDAFLEVGDTTIIGETTKLARLLDTGTYTVNLRPTGSATVEEIRNDAALEKFVEKNMPLVRGPVKKG